MDAVLHWQGHCKWRRTVRIEGREEGKKRITCECTPSPRDMALAAFGVQRSEWLDADSKLIRATVKRLLPCITRKGVKIPEDMIKAAARRASMPQTMSDFVWRNDVLCVACAMIRFNYEEEDKTMDSFLKDNEDDRNVLFGRLLAVYDYMEQRALFEKDDNGKIKEMRTTNAKRYWNAYCSRPAKTSDTIKKNLIAYERKLKHYELMKFEEWTGEIMVRLKGNEFDNRALSERYLPGYYLQMEEMKKAFRKKTMMEEKTMSEFTNKIDFEVLVMVKNANPNGDPLNGNRPRETYDGFGEISMYALSERSEIGCRIWEKIFLCRATNVPMMDARVWRTGRRATK